MANKKRIIWADHFTAQSKMGIKKGDTVMIIAGKDKGKQGKVLEVRPRENRVLVENANLVTKHKRVQNARVGDHQEGRIQIPAAIHRSNVMLVDSTTNKPTRFGFKKVEGKNVRVGKKSGEII